MSDQKSIARPRRNVNDMRSERSAAHPAGKPHAELPSFPISASDAEAEPPEERTFPDDGRPTTDDERPTPNSQLSTSNSQPSTPNDVTFTRGPARRPLPRVADPLLQWATGLQTKERRIYAGWLAEAGKIDALDEAMDAAGFSQVTIKHGSGSLVTHWAIETANVFVVADGVQSIGEMKTTWDRFGIAFGWRVRQDGRPQSHLRCRVFVRELLAVGFAEPLLLTVKGTLTGDLISALTRQYEVLDAVDAFRTQAGKPPLSPPFYACSIPLGPGQEVLRGTGPQSKEIVPIVANIPTPITKEYILAHWIKRTWVTLIESLIEQTIAWSETASALIAAGEEQAGAPGEDLL